MWITILLVMAVVLVGWVALVRRWQGGSLGSVTSPLLAQLSVGVPTFARSSRGAAGSAWPGSGPVSTPSGHATADLSPQESEELRDLLFLHDKIRDAATHPPRPATALRTAAGLLIPTIAFVITVFGEVSAERLLDAILP